LSILSAHAAGAKDGLTPPPLPEWRVACTRQLAKCDGHGVAVDAEDEIEDWMRDE
jgi:hypothetical protein